MAKGLACALAAIVVIASGAARARASSAGALDSPTIVASSISLAADASLDTAELRCAVAGESEPGVAFTAPPTSLVSALPDGAVALSAPQNNDPLPARCAPGLSSDGCSIDSPIGAPNGGSWRLGAAGDPGVIATASEKNRRELSRTFAPADDRPLCDGFRPDIERPPKF